MSFNTFNPFLISPKVTFFHSLSPIPSPIPSLSHSIIPSFSHWHHFLTPLLVLPLPGCGQNPSHHSPVPLHHALILLFHHSHSIIPSFSCSITLSLHYSLILLFHLSLIPLFTHSPVPSLSHSISHSIIHSFSCSITLSFHYSLILLFHHE